MAYAGEIRHRVPVPDASCFSGIIAHGQAAPRHSGCLYKETFAYISEMIRLYIRRECIYAFRIFRKPVNPFSLAYKKGHGLESNHVLFRFDTAPVSYLWKRMERVTDQLSPGATVAAAGLCSHLWSPSTGLGIEHQGSMQTNFGIPGLLQIKV